MTSSRLLQELHALDRSPPEFNDQLSNILYGETYKKNALRLQEGDLASLADFLDRVRCRVSPLRTPLMLL